MKDSSLQNRVSIGDISTLLSQSLISQEEHLYDRDMCGNKDYVCMSLINMLTNKLCIFQAELSNWHSHEHNMGLAFDRTTWNKIKKCSEVQRQL